MEGVFSPRPHVTGGALWAPFAGAFILFVGLHLPDPPSPRGPAPNTIPLGLGFRSLHYREMHSAQGGILERLCDLSPSVAPYPEAGVF